MNRRSLAWIAVAALAIGVRLALIVPRVGLPADDPDNYLPLAHAIAGGHGLEIHGRPSAYRPPLYPLVLAAVAPRSGDRFPWSIAVLHAVLGAITTLLTAVAARRWALSESRVLIAAILVAIDPVLVVQSRSVMTETLAACLLAAAVAGASGGTRRSAAIGGFAFGLAALCRPSTLPAAVLAGLFALCTGEAALSKRIQTASVLLLATAVPLFPWAVRNAIQIGEPVFTTTHGGYTIALANNTYYYRDVLNGPPGAVWSGKGQRAWEVAITDETRGMTEPRADRHLRNQAVRLMRERPGEFARASLARLGRFWGLAPASAVYPGWLRLATALWTAPFWLAVIAGIVRRESWKWPRSAAISVVLGLTLVHAVFWTDLRMRAPIVPALALLAASAGAYPGQSKTAGSEKN